MFAFSLLAATVLHDPTPDDIHRFGFDVRPIAESIPRAVWNAARSHAADLRRPTSAGRFPATRSTAASANWQTVSPTPTGGNGCGTPWTI